MSDRQQLERVILSNDEETPDSIEFSELDLSLII